MIVYDPDPAINERIRCAVRYGQTRWAEIWNPLIAVGAGLILLGPTETFSAPACRVISPIIDETTAGAPCVFFGALRLAALWVNGRRGRETSIIRTIGCIGGFFWLAVSAGMLLAVPPLSIGIAVFGILALSEIHASGRAAGDMAAEDTFGIRKRRRRNAGARSTSAA